MRDPRTRQTVMPESRTSSATSSGAACEVPVPVHSVATQAPSTMKRCTV